MSLKYYDGKEPCPGCGRPGTEVTRHRKDGLCYDCQDLLALGRQLKAEKEKATEYVNVTLHVNSCRNPKGNEAFYKFLSAISNEAAVANSWIDLLPQFGNNERRYKIPKYMAEAIKELLKDLKAEFEETMHERNRIPQQVEEQLNRERNKIYNEGVAYGRNLLAQLNRGEIGLRDFEAIVEKF